MFKKAKVLIVAVVTAVFLFTAGCGDVLTFGDPQKAELAIKLASRALAVKMIDRKHKIACEAKEYCEDFLRVTNNEDTEVVSLISVALKYIEDEIDVEDELLKATLIDIMTEINIDLSAIDISDDNFKLVRIAVAAYLDGCNIKIRELGIECPD